MGVSLWDMFFDDDWRQRRDINALEEDRAQHHEELEAMRRENRDLHAEINELSVTVMALMKELGRRGVIAPEEIRHAVNVRLGRSTFTCPGCNQVVANSDAQMTSRGQRCSTCSVIDL
ncbi:MAG: hypothetical protein QM831_13390 [Kofleriaceae bacterium]